MSSKPKHFLFQPHALWGHARPMLALACTLLVIDDDLSITFFVPGESSAMLDKEMDNYSLTGSQLARFVLVRYGRQPSNSSHMSDLSETPRHQQEAVENATVNYPRMLSGEKLLDGLSGQEVVPISTKVTQVIIDYVQAVRLPGVLSDIDGGQTKYVLFSPMCPAFMDLYVNDNASPPLVKNVLADIDSGEEAHDAWVKHFEADTLVKIPGCDDMYTYECPGNVTLEAWMPNFAKARENLAKHFSTHIFASSSYFGRETQRIWDNNANPVYQIGPLFPPQRSTKYSDPFLDDQPDGSAAYISFGSLYFPPNRNQVIVLLRWLSEREGRTIFALGNAPEEIRTSATEFIDTQRIGNVKLVDWVDQPAVLCHPAVGVFLSHAGQGAVFDGVLAGVPMIFWPGGVDQPLLANQLSLREKIGVELLQIRLGAGVGRKTARGPIVHGTDESLREELTQAVEMAMQLKPNVERAKAEISRDLQEGGPTYQALRELLQM